MEVDAGEVVAVMGPSGSGKSTLLHCLAGILLPDRGEVWFDGKRVDRLSEAKRTRLRREAFGFVFQFGQLVPELTATENVALPLLLGDVPRRQAEGTVATVNQFVLTDDLVERTVRSEIAYMASVLKVFARHGEANVEWFDHVLVFHSRSTDHRAWNRALGLSTGDEGLVDEILAWAEKRAAPIRLEVVPARVDERFLARLADRGLRVTGFRSAIYGAPSRPVPALPEGVEVEEIDRDRSDLFAEVWAQTVPTDDRARTRRMLPMMAEAYAAPEWRRFLARVEGSPVAFGVLYVADGIGSLAGAATAPQSRGRGAQSALIAHRIAVAAKAGCQIVVSQPPIGSSSQRNLERAGLRLAYQSVLWQR